MQKYTAMVANYRKVLIVLNDNLLAHMLELIFTEHNFSADIVDGPKSALDRIADYKYPLIVIGDNKGIVVKNKLAALILDKYDEHKPNIIIFKRSTENVFPYRHITIFNYPSLHNDISSFINSMDVYPAAEKSGSNTIIKNKKYEPIDNLGDFFHTLKGNLKMDFLADGRKINGFIMGNEFYFIYCGFDKPSDLFFAKNISAAREELKLSDVISIDSKKLEKESVSSFVRNGINDISDKNYLLSMLPKNRERIVIKAPRNIIKQSPMVNALDNFEDIFFRDDNLTLGYLKKQYNESIDILRAVIYMYMLKMIDFEELQTKDEDTNKKFDVKIKKGFLRKIMDRIRGL